MIKVFARSGMVGAEVEELRGAASEEVSPDR
jgi:hypothetical protein